MERPKVPFLCFLAAGLLILAVATDGFSFVHQPETRFMGFAGKLVAVRLACALLTASGLALCRADTRRQAAQVYLLAVGITLALCAWQIVTALGGGLPADAVLRVDLSEFLPGFVLILLGTELVCRTGTLCTVLDLAALGLSALLWLSPEWLFGWGVSACFFDILCMTSTLFVMPAVDVLRGVLNRMLWRLDRRSPQKPEK